MLPFQGAIYEGDYVRLFSPSLRQYLVMTLGRLATLSSTPSPPIIVHRFMDSEIRTMPTPIMTGERVSFQLQTRKTYGQDYGNPTLMGSAVSGEVDWTTNPMPPSGTNPWWALQVMGRGSGEMVQKGKDIFYLVHATSGMALSRTNKKGDLFLSDNRTQWVPFMFQ